MTQPLPPSDRPVLVHFSPLPPMRNGIADYAATLLKRFAERYECIAVVENPDRICPEIWACCHVISYDDYAQIAEGLKHERHLAHIGNNNDHIGPLNAMAETPGVVVLHDLTLHYLLDRWARATLGDLRQMQGIIAALHGSLGQDMVDAKLNRQVPVQAVYTELGGLPVLRETAAALITHSQYGRVLATAAGYENPIRVIPHFAEIPDFGEKERRRAEFRRRHGIAESTVVLSSLGFVTANKIVPQVLQTLAALPSEVSDWCYVIGGENRDPAVAKAIAAAGFKGRVIVLDYLEESEFDTVLAASDVVINLRVPTSGETSGTVCRALAHGLPCIVNAHGWYAELPDDATWKIDPGLQGCARELRVALLSCLLSPEARARKSTAALAYARSRLSLETAVSAYCEVIEASYAKGPLRTTGPAVPVIRPAPRALSFAPQQGYSTLSSAPEAVLSRLLEAEFATLPEAAEAPAIQRRVIPAAGPDIQGIARDCAAPVLTQGFAAVEVEEGIGGIVLAASDAAAVLREGDLFTLAVQASRPVTRSRLDALTLQGRALKPATCWGERSAAILHRAGFQILRQSHTDVPPQGPEDGYCEISVTTAVKIAQRKGIIPGFQAPL